MPTSKFKLPYPRPQSLSDPFHDHTPDALTSLLATSDDDLQWYDFKCLLGPLPAGTYEESAYFLPLAFDYILSHDDDALDLSSSLIWFISENAPELIRDVALDAARSQIQRCLDHWSGQFTVDHYDADACRDKGWGLDYFDYVCNSETVMEATNDLIRFKTHDDLAISFFANFANSESDAVKSAWFLECVRAHVSKAIRRPPIHVEIRQLLNNKELGIKHSAIVRESLPSYDPEATYWQDTFTLLGTIGYA